MLKLTDREWKEFKVGDFFEITRGNAKDISTNTSVGKIALISAIDNTNGLYRTISPTKTEHIYTNKITVNNNGNGVGLSYFHKYPFIASSDVSILIEKNNFVTQEVALFICNQIKKQKTKFNYGYKMANPRLRKQVIMLPVNNEGQPDYKFMEDYIKEVMTRKRKEYISYAETKLGGGKTSANSNT